MNKRALEMLVGRHDLEVDSPTGVDGAQMWLGKWWAPAWGYDTLQTRRENLEDALIMEKGKEME